MVRVLRLAAGDPLQLFDGRGMVYDAVIAQCARGTVSVQVKDGRREDRESPLRVTLAQAVSSGERMDYTIQKVVELGAVVIQPLLAERCVVRLSGERAEKRQAHWQGVVIAACEQCGRNHLPQVQPLLPLATWLEHPAAADDLRLLLIPGASGRLRQLPGPCAGVTLLAGPEGGLTAAEAAAAVRAGFMPLTLGPRVLRTETAAVAALAALQATWGDL